MKYTPFVLSLKLLLKSPKDSTVKKIFSILSEHGHPALILIFTLPLCFPIQIPGMSTPFGLLCSLVGVQIAFKKPLWLPNWLLRKKVSKKMLDKVVKKTINLSAFLQKFTKRRATVFTQNRAFITFNGILLFILALIVSLPIPIPTINLVSAIPIICISLGLLKEDGICVLVGYFFSIVCFLFFTWLIHLGFAGIEHLL